MTLGSDNGTDGQTDRQTDRQTDGQTDRQSATQYAAPPREEGRIIILGLIVVCRPVASTTSNILTPKRHILA